MLRLVDDTGPALVVVDSYRLPPEVYATVRAAGVPLVALVDGDPAGREADVYVNQNLGGERRPEGLAPGATYLGGVEFALMRDEILRATAPPAPRTGDRPRVLAFFGGTDPFGAAPAVAELLVRTGRPFEAVVVAADAALAERVRAVEPCPSQKLVAVAPLSPLASAVREADAVVSAAGTSVWELLCLGAAAAVVQVADNQRAGYAAVTAGGAAAGLGHLDGLPTDPAAARTAHALLTDPDLRAELRRRARATVDGQGRRRVVDAALATLTHDRSTAWSGS
jgi:spore coat polysaccharide biosynthesis predicted glycosyltransferase SpsG